MRHLFLALKEGIIEHRRSLLFIAGVVVAFVVVVQLVSYFAASHAGTCGSCHIMKPYVQMWETSPHKDVACVTCHTEWRFVLSTTYLRYAIGAFSPQLRAEVPDSRCLKCHEHQDLDTDETFLKSIHFSHKDHLGEMRRGKSLHCTSCHTGHFTMANGSIATHSSVDKSVCYTCHFRGAAQGKAVTGCLVCHGPPKTVVTHQGFTFDHASYLKRGVRCEMCHTEVVKGNADVPRDRCATCHVSRIEAYEDVPRVHQIHLSDHEIDCARCHTRMEHGKVAMTPALGERCDACHRPTHTAQEQMYIGIGGEGVPDSPSTMFLAQVACDSCHSEPNRDPRRGAEQLRKSCVTCHGQGYDRMVDDWINEMGGLVLDVTRAVQRAEAQVRGSEERERAFSHQLDEARHNLDFVRAARGEHNIHYAVELLRLARNDAAQVLAKTGGGTLPTQPILASASGYCRVCHSTSHLGTSIEFHDVVYDHNRHIAAGIVCATCHSTEEHGKTTITLEQCMACHHSAEQKRPCTSCHTAQASLYEGKLQGTTVKGDPDAMAQAGVGCTDCHDLASKEPLVKAVQKACLTCHEAGFDEMLVEWINEDQQRVQDLALLVARAQTVVSQEPTALAASHRASLQDAEKIYQALLQAKGVHNMGVAGKAADDATKMLSWVPAASH
jgi:hypothetical protein